MVKDQPMGTFGEKKNPAWNIFYMFDEMPRAKQGTAEMKALIDRFILDHKRISNKYTKEGLSDSASRDGTLQYLTEKMEPWRKSRRLRQESGLMELPYRE